MFYDLYEEDKINIENLAIGCTKKHKGKLKITHYVDMRTGELFEASEIESKYNIKSIRPEGRIRREQKINKLRKETKDFALFLLKFRNQSCGFMVPFERLIEWYSKYSGKRIDNIKRTVKTLIKEGILDDNEGVVFPHKDFMINNSNRTKDEAKSDPFVAGVIFNNMLLKRSE